MSGMSHKHESGAINVLLLPLLAAVLLLIAALVFAGWAYSGRQDYKNNVDAKVATAVKAAKDAESKSKEAEFAERIKNPLKTYTGPSEFGSVALKYPKTWSGYVVTGDRSDALLDAYFNPDVVNNIENDSTTFALHIKVEQESYNEVLDNYSSYIQEGKLKIQPYALPKLTQIVGSRLQGQIADNKTGTVIVLPLRDKTLSIITETDNFQDDFNNIILPNLTFSP